MPICLPRLCLCLQLGWLTAVSGAAQNPNSEQQIETLHTTTQLVVLDATVVDKHGHIVTAPLTRDDFEVQEDRRSQVIRYFESSAEHDASIRRGSPNAAPLLIVVLDELNFPYGIGGLSNADNTVQQLNDYEYERSELVRYLEAQPAKLTEPMEVLALTHHGYLIVAQTTHDRDLLIDRVKRRDPGLGSPYRDYLEEYEYRDFTLSKLSLQAIWSLALEERGVPGRKIVLWLGYGGPNREIAPAFGRQRRLSQLQFYFREVADQLVDARVTVDLVQPGLASAHPQEQVVPGTTALMSTPHSDGFHGYIEVTGGTDDQGNDVTGELSQDVNTSASYYTIAYAPANHDFDGQFRRIRVTVKGHPEWTVLTKSGYYGLQYGGEKNLEHQLQSDISIATFEAMPFSAIGATVEQVGRIQGSEEKGGFTARFVLNVDSDDLQWHSDQQTNGREADVAVSAAALGSIFAAKTLAAKAGTWRLTAKVLNSTEAVKTTVSIELHLPAKTQMVRFVVRDLTNGRMGTTQVGMKAVQAAPEIEERNQTLKTRPARQ